MQIHSPYHKNQILLAQLYNSRHYKQLVKGEKIVASNIRSSSIGLIKTKVDFIELANKQFLTINEASVLLNAETMAKANPRK